MPRILPTTIILPLALLLVGAAQADVTLHYDAGGAGPSSIKVSGGKVRIDSGDGQGHSSIMLFDSARETVTTIDPAERSYMEMSEATAAQMQQALNAMMAQARAQMAQLPPEQRQMMEQRMGGAMGGHVQAEPFTLKHTGRRGSAAGIGCEWVSVYQGASLFSETCVATPAAAGVSDADYRTLHAMFTLLGKMSRRMSSAARGADGSLMAPEIGGIAVLVRDNANGNNQSRLTTVDHSSLGAEQFQVPAGYQKVDPMADMGRL